MTPAIDVRDLRVKRGSKPVLHGIDLEIPAGRVTGLLGPSGCGKSTLMRAIVGVQVVESGKVRVLDAEAGTPGLRSQVGYVTQAPSIYADLTIGENLRYFAAISGAGGERIAEVLRAVDLFDIQQQVVHTLSGGQMARASLATALLAEPDVLVLDEPTVGLDPVLRRDLWSQFRALAAEGRTLLVSSHVMDEASECDVLILMRDGEIVAVDEPDAIRERTGQHDLGEAFLKLIEASA